MKLAEGTILEDGIQQQFESSKNSQRVGEFVKGVERRVEATVTELRVVHGDAVEHLLGKELQRVEGYTQRQLKIYDPNFKVRDTEAKGAAAWNEKGGDNSIAVGEGAMQAELDEGYWKRVVKHEEAHQLDQAAEFNRGSITYPGETIEVNPTLVEWHAITVANQPDSDLTPEYRSHRDRGDALVAFLGSKEPLLRALKTGDMQALQDHIHEMLGEKEQAA